MRKIMTDIKEKQFERVYLLYGEEDYLKQQYKNRLREGICGEDTMNVSVFQGKLNNPAEIISMADTLPFFADYRLLIIEESECFDIANEKLLEYLNKIPDTTVFVFVESKVDRKKKMFKRVKEIGYVCEMARQTPATLEKWVLGLLNKEEKKIDRQALDYFFASTGNDMNLIANELEKLMCYTSGKEVVTIEDINAVCSVTNVAKIFDMVDAMGVKNRNKTMQLYYDMLEVKEPPMKILYMLARQFEMILRVGDMKRQGINAKDIAKKTQMQPFVVNKVIRQSEYFSEKMLKTALNDCLDVEEDMKNGRLSDKMAVEMILLRYTA